MAALDTVSGKAGAAGAKVRQVLWTGNALTKLFAIYGMLSLWGYFFADHQIPDPLTACRWIIDGADTIAHWLQVIWQRIRQQAGA